MGSDQKQVCSFHSTRAILTEFAIRIWWPVDIISSGDSAEEFEQMSENIKTASVIGLEKRFAVDINNVNSLKYVEVKSALFSNMLAQAIPETLLDQFRISIAALKSRIELSGYPLESVKSDEISQSALVCATTKRTNVLSWDDYFMAVAFLSSQRSKDPSTQVGACIVNVDQKIVGIGYNGFPRGCSDDLLPWAREAEDSLDTKYPVILFSFDLFKISFDFYSTYVTLK